MDAKLRSLSERLLRKKFDELDERDRRVLRRVAERATISRDLSVERPDLGARVADKVAAFGGSWTFIFIFFGVQVFWVAMNTLVLTTAVDPYPFVFLNLILSMVAAVQAPVIMMSQNRQAARDKHESIIDFAINYKAEQEIDDMQRHLHRMEAELAEIKELLRERE